MSRGGAYEDEMGFMRGDDERELTAFAGTLRAALVPARAPGAARIVPMLAEAARASAAEAARPARPRRRLALAARVAFAVALLPLLSAGLAVAGVNLPSPAQSAFERVGIELPNQAGSGESASGDGAGASEDGRDAGDAKDEPGEPGSKGRENAAAKRGHGQDKSNPAREQGRGVGAQGKGRGLGKRGVAPGHSNPNRGGNGGQGGGTGAGNGNAVGKTGAPPPGQANKPVTPGKSDSAPGGPPQGAGGGKPG